MVVQGWEELMLVVESSMAGGRKEVALAAIAVITTLMQAHGTTKAVSRRYSIYIFCCLWYSSGESTGNSCENPENVEFE